MNSPLCRLVGIMAVLCQVSLPLAGCARSGAEAPAARGQASSPPAKAPPVTSDPATRVPSVGGEETIEAYMVEHFVLTTLARNALIVGRLETTRQALGALADHSYADTTPGDWRPWVDRLQAAARQVRSAKTPDEVARAVAGTASVCGECHRSRGRGPDFPQDYDADDDQGLSNTLSDRMERHVWAADRMWEGLTAPSDIAWNAGAGEVASLPSRPPTGKAPLPAGFAAALGEVRAIGSRARLAKQTAERVQIYARFIATCAPCHQR
jgi:cytochrome c553